jgi:DNA-binding transcriptional MerR regulator
MADDSRKLFYSIGEVADLFHVNESTLRFWEKEFPTVIKPKKNAKGTRNYTKDDIENVRLVHFLLKEKGMTLAGARKKLREEKKGMSAQHELSDRLKKIKSELLKLQTELGQPAQEAPEFPAEELIAKRMVFAEPGSEMISVESILEEAPVPELAMEELPTPEVEQLQVPEPMFEESPFDFYEEKPEEFEAEKFTFEPVEPESEAVEEIEEKPELLEAPEEDVIEEADAQVIPQPQPEPEPEPTPEQNLFYEQPESVEPPKPEPSKDGWSGSLF